MHRISAISCNDASRLATHGALISSRLEHHRYAPAIFAGLHIEIHDVLVRGNPDEAERAIRLHYMGTDWSEDQAREERSSR